MTPLAEKEQKIWEFIAQTQQKSGISPSIREIKKHFNFGSTRSAFDYVAALKKKGYLKREPHTAHALRANDPTAALPRRTIQFAVYGSIPAALPEKRTQAAGEY